LTGFFYGLASFCFAWTGLRDSSVMTTLKNHNYEDAVYGQVRKFAAIGWGCSGLVSGFMADNFGQTAMLCVFVAGQIVCLMLIWFIEWESPSKKPETQLDTEKAAAVSISTVLRSPWIFIFFANLLAYGVAASAVETYLFVFLLKEFQGSNDMLIGTTLATMTITELPVFEYGDQIVKRLGFINVFSACHIVFSLRCMLYSMLPSTNPWLVLLIEPLHGLSFALMWLAAVDFGRQFAPQSCKARFQGLVGGTYFQLASVVGSLMWGSLIAEFGFRTCYIINAFAVLAWSLLYNIGARSFAPKSSDLTEKLILIQC